MKPYWSISEACAWIVTGDLDAVEHVSISDPEAAHFLIGGDALPPYQFCEHVFEWPASCGWHALVQIQQYCGEGRLTMFGVSVDGGIHESIPRAAWGALKISHNKRLACFVAAPPFVDNPTTGWARLRLLSADVQRIWPPIAASLKPERRLPTFDEVTGWYLKERIAKHDPSHPPPSREEDEKVARVFFRKAGFRTGEALKELVRKVRTNEAPSDWTISGPKGRKIHAQAQRSNLARD
jgi:hypothetical protein